MSREKALATDLENLFLDPWNSDILLVCQGEEIAAHRVVLGARSPVFRAVFQSKMMESVKGEIRIDDADKDVLKEMLRYIYSTKVEEKFDKFGELLVLANKYEVEDLIKYCGTKILESLNTENAFEIGTFAELHNAEDLMHQCVKFIIMNKSDILKKDWKDQLKGSPKMMLETIQQLVDDEIHEISRMGQNVTFQLGGANQQFAVAFQVDSKMILRGISIFGSQYENQNLEVVIKVFNDVKNQLHEETLKFQSRGCPYRPHQLLFTKSISIEANEVYHITTYVPGGQIYYGQNLKQVVNFEDPGKGSFKVTFSQSHHGNGYSLTSGLVPDFYFSKG